jgi:hypothetical protein
VIIFFSSLDQVVQNMWDFISPQTEKKGKFVNIFFASLYPKGIADFVIRAILMTSIGFFFLKIQYRIGGRSKS